MQSKLHVLPMLSVQQQALRRGSCSSAYLQVESTGVQDAACRLFARVNEVLLAQTTGQGALPGFDALQPEALADKLYAQVSTMPELSDPGLNPEDQAARLRVLQKLRGHVGDDLGRALSARASAIVREETERFCSELTRAYGVAPASVRDTVQVVRTALERMRLPEQNEKALTRWLNLQKIADRFRQRRAGLPPSTVKSIQEAITGEVRNLYEQSLRDLTRTFAVAAWVEAKRTLVQFLDDLAKRTSESLAAVAAVKKCLENTRAAVAKDQHVSRASVVKPLPGPTEAEVVAGLLGQLNAPDETALARLLLDRYGGKLREVCPKVCAWIDKTESLAELLRNVPPDAQGNGFLEVIEQAMGPGQSLYEIVEREGVLTCADFLYRRSEPTVDLSGRDMAQLGICPDRLCIITLPEPLGPNDSKIREDLRAAFQAIDPYCSFADAPATDRTVTAVRLIIGFPIGIEAQNAGLVTHYLSATDQGHLPHLFSILPGCDGKAIDEYRSLLPLLSPVQENMSHARFDHR